MKVNLTLDKSSRTEIYFDRPSIKIKNLAVLDSLAVSLRSLKVVVNPEFLEECNNIKLLRNSKYKLIGCIDPECKSYGSNKIFHIQNLMQADGFDIGLTVKDHISLINEIKLIDRFLKMASKKFDVRWIIDSKHGSNHIDNCIKAIMESKTNNKIICLAAYNKDESVIQKLIKDIRLKLGNIKLPIKIITNFDESIINDKDLNLTYQFKAEELV